jgi:hypothetical protein
LDVIDLATPTDTSEQNGELGLKIEGFEESIYSGQAVSGGGTELDASWLAVAGSGVACVLCTVRGFQLRCVAGVAGGVAGTSAGASKERSFGDGQNAMQASMCEQCGLGDDWGADDRLRDSGFVHAARILGLWEQMKSFGTSLGGGFDTRQMAAACVWLETGAKGRRPPK